MLVGNIFIAWNGMHICWTFAGGSVFEGLLNIIVPCPSWTIYTHCDPVLLLGIFYTHDQNCYAWKRTFTHCACFIFMLSFLLLFLLLFLLSQYWVLVQSPRQGRGRFPLPLRVGVLLWGHITETGRDEYRESLGQRHHMSCTGHDQPQASM